MALAHSKKGQAPGSRFYEFLLLAPASCKKVRLPGAFLGVITGSGSLSVVLKALTPQH